MNKDQLVEGPFGSDACYETEVVEGFTTYQCYGCGFTTTTMMKEGTPKKEALNAFMKRVLGSIDQ